jgi:hypothetical protein
MRTLDEIAEIKSRISDPFVLTDILSPGEIGHLIDIFENPKAVKLEKSTGPKTLDLADYYSDPVVSTLIERLQDRIGPFEITTAFFFWTNFPHVIHNDDTFELPPNVYKGITVPLRIEGSATPKLCFFDQFFFHGPSKFFKGSINVPTYYNRQLYDYALVDGLTDMPFDESTRCTYLSHLNPRWLEGLSLWGTLDWRLGTALVFDSTRLHCASDFRQQGIKSKLAISIFTKVV